MPEAIISSAAVPYRLPKRVNRVLVGTSGCGAKRSFGEPTITLEAKARLTSLSCRKAKELGYPHELWTTRLLAPTLASTVPPKGTRAWRTRKWPSRE
jgi:hypothetical protein